MKSRYQEEALEHPRGTEKLVGLNGVCVGSSRWFRADCRCPVGITDIQLTVPFVCRWKN